MPQNEKRLFIHELSNEHQTLISEYITNFHKNDPRIKNTIKHIRDTNEIFYKLNKIDSKLAFLFIEKLPLEPLEKGNELLYELYAVFKTKINNDLSKDNVWLEINQKFEKYYDEQLIIKHKLIVNEILPKLLKNIDSKKKSIFEKIHKILINCLSDYHNHFFKLDIGYCTINCNLTPINKTNNFHIYNLVLNETMKESMEIYIKKIKEKGVDYVKKLIISYFKKNWSMKWRSVRNKKK